MIPAIRAQATAGKPNPDLKERPREPGADNLAWLAAALAEPVMKDVGQTPGVLVLLLGGTDETAFRLRVAQSHARSDMTPSVWSHAALVASLDRQEPGRSVLIEVPLDPLHGFGWAPRTNGVVFDTACARYADAGRYPNIALLYVPTEEAATIRDALDRFRRERNSFDCCALILQWLAFCWGTGRAGNPLLDGVGIPSAVLVERVLGVAGRDLAPGMTSLASTPEGIWQGARFWYAYRVKGEEARMRGVFSVENALNQYTGVRGGGPSGGPSAGATAAPTKGAADSPNKGGRTSAKRKGPVARRGRALPEPLVTALTATKATPAATAGAASGAPEIQDRPERPLVPTFDYSSR